MKKEIELLLIEAEFYHKSFMYDKALITLHKITEKCPKNLIYKYLLATTYMEAGNNEAAREQTEIILRLDNKYKEALELLGMINMGEGKYKEAEINFLNALNIDPNFLSARKNLITLYFNHLLNYEEVEKHCKYILEHCDTNRSSLPIKKKKDIYSNWFLFVITSLIHSLSQQKKYEEAIPYIREHIQEYYALQRKYNPIDMINEYGKIYQFYYLMGDEKKLEKFKQEYREIYKGMPEEDIEQDFRDFEEWALERYT